VSRSSNASVALAIAMRAVTTLLKNPSLFVPPMLFPLMSFAAFAGGLSRLSHIPDFQYSAGYTSFQFVFVLLQSAAFGGVFVGFAIARDFERGFARRLLLAAPSRGGLIAGYALGSLFRWSMVAALLTVVGLIAGMQVGGDGIDLFGLYGLAVLVNLIGMLWAAGIAMRIRSSQAGPLMQTPVFVLLFLSPVYVPLALLQGWIYAVASANPVTLLLTTGRGLLAGDAKDVALAFGLALLLAGAFAVWARLGLRRAEAAGGG
jgi:ABC-2 type transport system permease protein